MPGAIFSMVSIGIRLILPSSLGITRPSGDQLLPLISSGSVMSSFRSLSMQGRLGRLPILICLIHGAVLLWSGTVSRLGLLRTMHLLRLWSLRSLHSPLRRMWALLVVRAQQRRLLSLAQVDRSGRKRSNAGYGDT